MSVNAFAEITRGKPEKSLLKGRKNGSGRNNQGKITIRHQGGGHKKRYRLIDFNRTDKLGIPGKVVSVEYDPFRTAFIMLVNYKDGEKRYHLAPDTIQVGSEIICDNRTKISVGNRMPLKHIPSGIVVSNVELSPKKGGQIVRSAGSRATLLAVEGNYALIQMPSGEQRRIEKECFVTIGSVSNLDHSLVKIGKAGRSRWLGRRPSVRGKVMNPVDHPHGGGEGLQSIGMTHPKTPWGLPALGVKTRKRKYSDKFIVRRRRGNKMK